MSPEVGQRGGGTGGRRGLHGFDIPSYLVDLRKEGGVEAGVTYISP